MPELSEEFITKYMGKDELFSTIGWNAIRGFISSIILILAFIKLLELITYNNALFHIILFITISMGIYYYYFWSGKPDINFKKNKDKSLTLSDFFYTTEIEAFDNTIALIASWIGGLLIYGGFSLIYIAIKYCFDNSESEITMSIVRLILIGLIATAVYIYGKRFEFRRHFLGTLALCFVYGFALSISAYLLGMVIGFSNMFLGVPLTIAILVLQFSFTSVYTYMDLLEWSKLTHTILIKDEENKIKEENKKRQNAEIPTEVVERFQNGRF